MIAVLLLAIIAGGVIGYREYTKLRDENKRLSNPQEAAKNDSEKIKGQVAALIEVPTDEEPTIATVVDTSKLSGQPFFAKAQNDDRVLMYQKAKKAILYRPSTNKIIEVAPINIGDESSKASSTKENSDNNTDKADQPAGSVDPATTEQPAFNQ